MDTAFSSPLNNYCPLGFLLLGCYPLRFFWPHCLPLFLKKCPSLFFYLLSRTKTNRNSGVWGSCPSPRAEEERKTTARSIRLSALVTVTRGMGEWLQSTDEPSNMQIPTPFIAFGDIASLLSCWLSYVRNYPAQLRRQLLLQLHGRLEQWWPFWMVMWVRTHSPHLTLVGVFSP